MIKEFKLPVKGMTCAHCAESVSEALELVNGVEDVQVNLDAHEVMIEADDQEFDPTEAAKAVKNAGYELVLKR